MFSCENVEIEDKPQWVEFAKLLEISMKPNKRISLKSDSTGIKSITAIWNEIWSGQEPVSKIDELVKDYSEQRQAGIKKYQELHPDYVPPEPETEDPRVKREN